MTAPLVTGSWIDVIHVNQKDGVYWNRKTLAYSDADWDPELTTLRLGEQNLNAMLSVHDTELLGESGAGKGMRVKGHRRFSPRPRWPGGESRVAAMMKGDIRPA